MLCAQLRSRALQPAIVDAQSCICVIPSALLLQDDLACAAIASLCTTGLVSFTKQCCYQMLLTVILLQFPNCWLSQSDLNVAFDLALPHLKTEALPTERSLALFSVRYSHLWCAIESHLMCTARGIDQAEDPSSNRRSIKRTRFCQPYCTLVVLCLTKRRC